MATTQVRLNQIIAVRKGVQADTHSQVTRLHHDVQKAPLLSGIARTYRPVNDADPVLPGESTRVQVHANRVLQDLAKVLTRRFDVTATVDWTNRVAVADVVVDGAPLITGAPVSFLLFLEKQLVDVHAFVSKLPTLDPAEEWRWSDDADAWAAGPATTARTQKVMRNHEVAPATERHPAQVQVWQEDVVVGFWETLKFSGALPAARVKELLDRVAVLAEAVKYAREKANMQEIVDPKPAKAVFDFLLRH